MIIVSNINIAVAIKRGGRPTRLLPHAKMLLVPRKFFLSLSLRGRLCSGSVQVSLLSRFISVEYSRILTNPYIKYITCLVSLFSEFYLFVGWVSFFCVKLQEVVIIFNIARRGRSFIK